MYVLVYTKTILVNHVRVSQQLIRYVSDYSRLHDVTYKRNCSFSLRIVHLQTIFLDYSLSLLLKTVKRLPEIDIVFNTTAVY